MPVRFTVACHCIDRASYSRLADIASIERVDLRRFERWESFRSNAIDHSAFIIVDEVASKRQKISRMRKFRSEVPFKPVILLTAWEETNVASIARIGFDEVIWLHRIEDRLQPVLRDIRTLGILGDVLSWIRSSEQSPVLNHALEVLLTGESSILSVEDLARRAGRSARTIQRHWATSRFKDGMRLKELIDWVLLLKAHGRKTQAVTWQSVEQDLGLSSGRLRRITLRLTNQTPDELWLIKSGELVEKFRDSLRAL